MDNYLYGRAESKYYENPCHVFALDEYKKDRGEDEFSRKQVWFCVYGDDEIEEEFHSGLKSLLKSKFVEDDIEWDLMTLYPTHVEGEVNPHMQALLKSLSSELGIEYRQILERNETIEENHELDSTKAKVVNLEGTIDTHNFDEKNIILVDNISLTGTSLLHGTDQLINNGAERVFGVCLGLGESFPDRKNITGDEKASDFLGGT